MGLLHGYQRQRVSLDIITWDSSFLKQPSTLWTIKLKPDWTDRKTHLPSHLRVKTQQTSDGFMVNMFLYVPPAEMVPRS